MKIVFRAEWKQYIGTPFQFTFLQLSFLDPEPYWHVLIVGILGFNWNFHWGKNRGIDRI